MEISPAEQAKRLQLSIQTNGFPVEAILRREDGRWTICLFAGIWLEDDLRKELQDMALIIDPTNPRTNGIALVQVKSHYAEKEPR